MSEELLSPGEAAAYLGISRQRLTQLRERGQITAYRIGRFWVYPKDDLDRRRQELERWHAERQGAEDTTDEILVPGLVAAC